MVIFHGYVSLPEGNLGQYRTLSRVPLATFPSASTGITLETSAVCSIFQLAVDTQTEKYGKLS